VSDVWIYYERKATYSELYSMKSFLALGNLFSSRCRSECVKNLWRLLQPLR
jgi:hypothetical protein